MTDQNILQTMWNNLITLPIKYSFWQGVRLPTGKLLAKVDDDIIEKFPENSKPPQYYLLDVI